jgi:hypothetical protein
LSFIILLKLILILVSFKTELILKNFNSKKL